MALSLDACKLVVYKKVIWTFFFQEGILHFEKYQKKI